VILAFFYGQSRIFFTMARDGLLPTSLARVSSRGTPVRITIFTAIVVAVIAGIFPLEEIAALANAGTLTAFIAVSACMLAMRKREPNAPRKFTAPAPWVVGTIAILGCAFLFWSLPIKTREYFVIWNAIGLVLYWVYGSPRAEMPRTAAFFSPTGGANKRSCLRGSDQRAPSVSPSDCHLPQRGGAYDE
jgi:APA family basic amino acid/polyamine antiporter